MYIVDAHVWAALPPWAKFLALGLGYRPEPVHTRAARVARRAGR